MTLRSLWCYFTKTSKFIIVPSLTNLVVSIYLWLFTFGWPNIEKESWRNSKTFLWLLKNVTNPFGQTFLYSVIFISSCDSHRSETWTIDLSKMRWAFYYCACYCRWLQIPALTLCESKMAKTIAKLLLVPSLSNKAGSIYLQLITFGWPNIERELRRDSKTFLWLLKNVPNPSGQCFFSSLPFYSLPVIATEVRLEPLTLGRWG